MRKVAAVAFGIISLLSFEVAAKSPAIGVYPCPVKYHKACVKCQTGCREAAGGCIIECTVKDPSDPICKTCIPKLNTCLDGCTK